MRELQWVANYSDGTKLEQFQNGVEQKYSDIDREKLTRFDMVEKETGKAVHSVYLRDGQQLIFRKRTLIPVGQEKRVVVFLVGWKQTVMTNSGAKNIIVINYIYEDGSVALDGSRDNLELLPFE